MNSGPMQLALRALRTELSRRKTWVVILALSAIVGVSGPFQTYEYFGLGQRLIYWTLVVICTYCIGSLVGDVLEIALASGPVWLRLVVTSLVLSIFVTAFIFVTNGMILGEWPQVPEGAFFQFTRIAPICVAITLGSYFFVDPIEDRAAPTLLSRLDYENRGSLVALSVSDHYVSVITTKGEQLVLMRLSDAIKETAPTDGMQIHRSHWIAMDHISKLRRDGDRAICVMTTGHEIPVSRTYMPKIREAGLLPRKTNA